MPKKTMGLYQIICLLCFLSFVKPKPPISPLEVSCVELFLNCSLIPTCAIPYPWPSCHCDERDALIQFKNSLAIHSGASYFSCDHVAGVASYPKTHSWNEGLDCCQWDGITCDFSTGRVISLDLSCSWLHGSLTSNSSLFSLQYLQSLNLAFNNFPNSSILSGLSVFTKLTHLNLSGSYFSGDIPPTICSLTRLVVLNLSNNSFIGTAPQCLSNFSLALLVLDLRMNRLQGTIPGSFLFNNSLSTISLSQNHFVGKLPWALVNCNNLEVLDLGHNKLEDSFPDWLGTLHKLKVLILRSNNFEGLFNISTTSHLFPNLRILDLSNNFFHGPLPTNLFANLESMINAKVTQNESLYMGKIPPFIGRAHPRGGRYTGLQPIEMEQNLYVDSVEVTMRGREIQLVKILIMFTTIDLSNNSFEGNIPEVIGNLQALKGLNLAYNNLTGSIPASLGRLTNLEWLDLRSNKLGGVIPKEMIDLTSLAYLNLSENQLTGRIPQGEQWWTFNNDSFACNPDLCGPPLSKACIGNARPSQSSSTVNHEGWSEWKFVCMGYACGCVVGFSLGYIALEIGRPKWVVRMVGRWRAKWLMLKKPSSREGIRFVR